MEVGSLGPDLIGFLLAASIFLALQLLATTPSGKIKTTFGRLLSYANGIISEVSAKFFTPGFHIRIDWVYIFALCVLALTIFGALLAVAQTYVLLRVAHFVAVEESAELWQAIAALAQVPLLAAASVAFYRWSVQRKLGPEIAVGIFPPTASPFNVDLLRTMPNMARHVSPQIASDSAKWGACLMLGNIGERGLERVKVQITTVMPNLGGSFSDIQFKQPNLEAFQVVGLYSSDGKRGLVTSENEGHILVGSAEHILSPNEVWAIRFKIYENTVDETGSLKAAHSPFDAAILRVRVWGSNLERVVDQYLVLVQDIDSLPSHLLAKITSKNVKMKSQ